MAQLIASNALLNDRTSALRTLLNSGHTLRVFQNNLTPTPVNVLSDFTEANWTGYAAQALTNDFAAPTKVQDGEYQTQSSSHTFNFSSGSSQTVYGIYIDDGTSVKFSLRFDNPVTMTVGVSFSVQINAQDWALSIVP